MSLLSGLLIALSFPTLLFGHHLPNLGFLAWFGLVTLFLSIYDAPPKKAFVNGFIAASIYYLIAYYWIFIALHHFGNVPPLASVGTLLLLAVAMALYEGLACFLARWIGIRSKGEAIILLPALWTLVAWAKNYTPFGGFPWSNLSMSQSNYLPLIQIADITGVYGIIFLLVWFNVWLTELVFKLQGKTVLLFRQKTIVTFILIGMVVGYGFFKISVQQKEWGTAPHLKVGLIQPNIPENQKWNETFLPQNQAIFQEAVQSLQNHADLIVWPETAWFETLPLETAAIPPQHYFVTPQTKPTPYTLLGLSFFRLENNQQRYFNSAALLDNQGNILGKYHKNHLVPFGEYVPLKKLFYFLAPVAAIGDFERGESPTPLSFDRWKLAPLICFEDIFPELSRTMVRNGANLLVNMTNDAWYGLSSAAYQHLALAQFRAVENRRAMVRATNTGISAVIDPTGKVVNSSSLFERSVLLHQVPLLTEITVYTKLGDWFAAATLLFILWQFLKSYTRKSHV